MLCTIGREDKEVGLETLGVGLFCCCTKRSSFKKDCFNINWREQKKNVRALARGASLLLLLEFAERGGGPRARSKRRTNVH